MIKDKMKILINNKYFYVFLLFFCLIFLNNCGGGGGSAGSNNASILDMMSANDVKVTTLNEQTNLILSDVFVSIAEAGKEQVILKSANTGDSGVYIFSKIKIGSYVIKASKAGYETTTKSVIVTNGPQEVVIKLKPSYPPDSISGKVKRSDTHEGIPDVTVEIKDSSPIIKAITDSQGNYVLTNVQPTGPNSLPYILKATKPGFQPTERPNVIKLPNIALKDVDIIMQASGTATVMLPGKIIGVVKNRDTNEPIENIQVTLQDSGLPSDYSRSTGYYKIENVEAGRIFILTAIETTPKSQHKYKPYSQQVQLSSEQILVQDILMEPIQPTPEPEYGWLIGTVIDSVTKNAIAGVSVELLGTTLYDITKANGSFRIDKITPDMEYIALFSKPGYISQTHKRTVQKNQNNMDPIELVPQASSQNYCSIIGVVRDKDTKVTLPGVTVELNVPDTNAVTFTKVTTTTTTSGAFVFEKIFIPNNKVETGQIMTMVLSRNDYVSLTLQIEVKGGIVNQIAEDKTELTKLKGTIMGTVVDSDTNLPIPGATVALSNFTYPGIQNPTTSSAGNAMFQFSQIPVGTYSLIVTANEYATEVKNGITISYNGQTIGPLTIQLKKDYGTITGFVYIETNGIKGYQSGAGGDTPISGISVIASKGGQGGEIASDISKLDGSYSLKNLPISNILIISNSGTSSNPNYTSYTEAYSVVKGLQTFNIELANTKGNISGLVYEDVNKNGTFDNEPLISGAVVTVNQGGQTVTSITDALGNFILSGLNFGTLTITATKTSFKDASKTVTLPMNSNLSNVQIGLYKPTGKIVGRVVDANTSDPKQGIAGVQVKLLGFSNFIATTDSTGGYTFNNILAKTGGVTQYTVIADGSALGFGSATQMVDAPEEDNVSTAADIALSKSTRLIYGKIVDLVTQVGISQIKVKIQGTNFEAETDNSGIYVFNAVPVSTTTNYTLSIVDTVTINGATRYKPRDDVSITVNNETTPFKVQNISLTPNLGKIRGVVYDSITGYPIRSSLFTDPIQAEIVILNQGGTSNTVSTTVSALSGEFLLENIPSGNYNLKIRHAVSGSNLKMFEDTIKSATVNSGQITDLGIIYVTLKTITLRGFIGDRIVNDQIGGNFGISNALVQASINGVPYTKSTTTSYDGTYQMTLPVYSDYTIKVTATNYMDSEETSLTFQLPGPHTKNFYINPRVGNITGTVYLDSNNNGYYDTGDTIKIKDAHPKYITGQFIVKTNYRGVLLTTTVESNSTFRFSNIPVGSYYLTIDPPPASLDPAYGELNSTSWLEGPNGNRIINVTANNTTTISGMVITKTTYPTGSISGNIVDAETLTPLAGTKVQVSAGLYNQNYTTYTDSSGYFSITNLVYYKDETDTTEVFTVNITRDSYVTIQREYVMCKTPDASREVNIYEKMTKVTGSITGRVKDAQNNLPLQNVQVSVIGLNIPPVTTDNSGAYTIINVPAGTYKLYFLKLNSAMQPDATYSTYTMSNVQVVSTTPKVVDDVFLSTQFSSISGVIYFESNGINGYQVGSDKPLSDVTVTATSITNSTLSYTYTTASDGKYYLTQMQLGSYELKFSVPSSVPEGYYASPITINLTNTTPVEQNVEMYAQKGDLYGVIFNDENKNGIKDGNEEGIVGIDITPSSVFGSFTTFRTGANGEYEFKNMNPVTGQITVENGNNIKTYKKKVLYPTITAGKRLRLDIPMEQNTVTIYGKVVDSKTLQPISGINVSIDGTSISTTTDSDGKYTLTNAPLGSGTTTFKITFEALSLGYQTQTVTSPGTTGDDIVMNDVTMQRSTRNVRGRVVNSDLQPIQNVTVKLIDDTDVTPVTTDINGYFTLNTVSVDLVNQKRLELSAIDYEVTLFNFLLGTGTTTYVITPDIQMKSSLGEISGIVLDELTNGPVSSPNFSISINITHDQTTYSTTTNADGSFKIKNVKKGGPFDIVIQSNKGSNQYFNDRIFTVTLSPGQKYNLGTIYIKLHTISVKGTVYDSKVYNLASSANNLSRAGVSDAIVKAKYRRFDGTYYQVTSAPTISGGSFEVQLPALRFDFEVSCTNYQTQNFPGINIDTYPNTYNNLDFKIKPQTTTAYGMAYFDKNGNGYVDSADEPIFTANGGAFQNLVNTLIVSYDYRSFTFDTFVQSDSTFTIIDLPIAPNGTKRFTIYDRYLGNNIAPSPWRDSNGNTLVLVNSGGTTPSSIDIAVSIGESQYGTVIGQIYDDKIWTEGYELYKNVSGFNRYNTNYHVSNAKVTVTSSSGFNQTFDAFLDGRFIIKLPGNNTYTFTYKASGYSDTSETNVFVQANQVKNVEARMYPKFGSISGTIYYDNNLNGVNSEPTDYNHLPEASEPIVNSVIGHPVVSSNWTGATFNVVYSYRGLTFGTTSYSRTNSRYTIEKVPVGTYSNLIAYDVTSLSNWSEVGNDYSSRQFMSQVYTLDGKNPASVTVNENQVTTGIDFAVMVWGGHITGIVTVGESLVPNVRSFFIDPNNGTTTEPPQNFIVRGEDYWLALGGTLDQLDGMNIQRKYFLELLDVRAGGGSAGIKPLRFKDAQGEIRIFSYPVGSDPDIIIPPGTYVLTVAGDADASQTPMASLGYPWVLSSTNQYYKYNLGALLDRCRQVFYYYRGNNNQGIEIKAGQTHIINTNTQ